MSESVFEYNKRLFDAKWPPMKYVIVHDFANDWTWILLKENMTVVTSGYRMPKIVIEGKLPDDCHQVYNSKHFTYGDTEKECYWFESISEWTPPEFSGQGKLFD